MNKKIIAFASLFFIWQPDAFAISNTPLSSFIKIALEDNLGLKSERLSLSQGEINLNKAKKSEFYPEIGIAGVIDEPSIELNLSISRPHPVGGKVKLNLKTTNDLSTSEQDSEQDSWEASLESEEPLSKSARQILKTPLFDEQIQLDIAKLNIEGRINDLIYEVINSYTQLQRLNFTFIIKTKELEDLQDNIEISKLKFEKGIIPQMDIFQMELQASSVLSEMETLKKEKRNQLARFAQVLGTQTTIEDMQNNKEGFLELVKVLKGYVEHYQQLLSREDNKLIPFFIKGEFPQVKTKYLQIELAKRRLKEAETKNTPILIPAFTVNRSGNTTQKEFKTSVKFTLYDKGVKKEEIKLAQASLSQANIELNNLLVNTRIDITSTLDEIKDMERRMDVSNKDIGISEKIYEIAKIKHTRGLISSKDLLEYQTDVFRKQKNIFEVQTNLFLEYVKLLKITGELYYAYQKGIF